MCIHKLKFEQFCDFDPSFVKHIDWDKTNAIVTCEMINIMNTCIAYDIKSHFNRSQCIMGLNQGSIAMDSTCLIALIMVLLSTRLI